MHTRRRQRSPAKLRIVKFLGRQAKAGAPGRSRWPEVSAPIFWSVRARLLVQMPFALMPLPLREVWKLVYLSRPEPVLPVSCFFLEGLDQFLGFFFVQHQFALNYPD